VNTVSDKVVRHSLVRAKVIGRRHLLKGKFSC